MQKSHPKQREIYEIVYDKSINLLYSGIGYKAGAKKPQLSGFNANSLTLGVSAVKLCISRTRRKYITNFLSRVNSLSSQMDSQFGRDRKLYIGFIRDMCNLEEIGMSHQKPILRKRRMAPVSIVVGVQDLEIQALGSPLL